MTKDLEKILSAIASAPAHCDSRSEKDTAIWLKREKALPGFQTIFESCPDIIQECPVLHKRTYTELSTSARIVYEFGLDGSIAAAAVAMGYFASAYGLSHGIPCETVGPLEAKPGKLTGVIQHLINRSSSIGANLFAIGSQEINLWPNEVAIMRIEEDLASLFLHVKFTLSPFGYVLIVPTGDTKWLTKKISIKRVCQEAGLDFVTLDQHGRILLQWNPPVPKVQSTPLWKLPSAEEISQSKAKDRLSFSQLLKNTQDKIPQKIMLASSRSDAARLQNSATYGKPSPKKKSTPSQSTPGSSSSPSQEEHQTPVSASVFFQEVAFTDLDED